MIERTYDMFGNCIGMEVIDDELQFEPIKVDPKIIEAMNARMEK